MGIEGLLNLLKPITNKQHISSFANSTVGIDILPWLYKGCYSDLMEMQDSHINGSTNYTCGNFLLRMLDVLQQNNVKVIFVYDGRSLAMKGETINKRNTVRNHNNNKAKQMLSNNNCKQAKKYLSRSVRIDESIIVQSMRILTAKKIQFIVAPYQSDSQLAKLFKLGLIDVVITQDSDLLVYGCDVIYKLDEQGMCDYVQLSKVNSWELDGDQHQYLKLWLQFDDVSRIAACVLAGCDYVASIKGVGIKKAIKMVNNQTDIIQLLLKLRNDKVFGERVPQFYEDNVIKAFMIFQHALTFNTLTHQLEPLSSISQGPIEPEMFDIIGFPYPEYFTLNTYKGQANPRTLQTRVIEPIELNQNKTRIETNLKQIKNNCLEMDEEQSSCTSQQEMHMFEVYKNTETSMENVLWQFEQNFVNVCVNCFLP